MQQEGLKAPSPGRHPACKGFNLTQADRLILRAPSPLIIPGVLPPWMSPKQCPTIAGSFPAESRTSLCKFYKLTAFRAGTAGSFSLMDYDEIKI